MAIDSILAVPEWTAAPEYEIEITPEMIEAGAEVIEGLGIDTDAMGYFSPPSVAKRAYLAMERVRLTGQTPSP